jgi:hypothetical protein
MGCNYSQVNESTLDLDLLQKIQELEASHSRVSLSFNNEDKSIFYRWKRIQVICQDFEIENNKPYFF